MRLRLFLLLACVPVLVWALLPVLASGGRLDDIEKKIDRTERRIERHKAREGVLSGTIARYSARINALQRSITEAQRREAVLQQDLDAKKEELLEIQADLRRERARLARLKAKLTTSRRVLAVRLRELYKTEEPDIITVVLSSQGFADLLERSEFIGRVNDQDARIITAVRRAKKETESITKRLAKLERRQRVVTLAIQARRDQVARVRDRIAGRRSAWAEVRSDKNAALSATRDARHEAEEDLAALEEESAKVQARLQGLPGPSAAGPVRQGSGSLIWPINASITSPFGMRWGRLHAGIDMGAGSGTPIRAAASGRVVIAGWTGGYGNYTCIQHSGSMSTCYAHQSGYAVSSGQSVRQGQVIGYVGNTGHSFGAHLHFEVRINGSPTDPMGYL